MPPRKRISAPAGRVYKSTVPLNQTRFPSPKKRISYGKTTRKRVPKPDNTLTQMDFVNLNQGLSEDDRDLYEAEQVKPQKAAGKLAVIGKATDKSGPAIPKKQRRRAITIEEDKDGDQYVEGAEKYNRKRRRATGLDDEEVKAMTATKRSNRRKTMGDTPASTSNFHTQTLTQMESWSSDSVFDVPPSSQILDRHQKPRGKSPKPNELPQTDSSTVRTISGAMGPPQTPRRRLGSEIPSSQSPATPLSLPSRSHRSSSRQTPLREISANAPIPFSTTPKSPYKPHLPEIPDSFATDESQLTRIPTSSAKPISPAKSVRWADQDNSHEQEDEPEEEDGLYDSTPNIKREPNSPQFPASQGLSSQSMIEILDSDAESDMELEDHVKSEAEDTQEQGQCEVQSEEESSSSEQDLEDEEQEPETCYGEFGLETQIAADQLLGSQGSGTHIEESQILGGSEPGTTQFMESQRISTQDANLMAPRKHDSDIFISIHPPHLKNIRNRTKDHEFRTWAFPPSVVRIWFYETRPASTLKYMAAISPAKRPGEILNEKGIGNAEFNAKSANSSEYAYEILDLYALANPLTLDELKQKEWLNAAPQKMKWVNPVVLANLMGNLKPPIFTRTPIGEATPASSSTDTQELEGQLLSTIQQFTQPVGGKDVSSSSPAQEGARFSQVAFNKIEATPDVKEDTSTPIEETPEESPEEEPSQSLPHAGSRYPSIRPSQAETVDLSQAETPQSLPEIVWESPSRPVLSSTPQLPTPFAREVTRSESIVPFSSQLLTKSQMLPDSLLNDSVPAPPDFIQDSDEEDLIE